MWQISWMLSLLPDWVWHIVVFSSIIVLLATWVLKFIPFIGQYTLPIQVGAILLLLLGIWTEGALSNEEKWKIRVQELEAKVAAAEVKSTAANVAIANKVAKRIEQIRVPSRETIEYVDKVVAKDKEVTKFVDSCSIPQIVIKTHNAAALNQSVEETK